MLLLWSVIGFFLWPGVVKGAACPDFPWNNPPEMMMPSLVRQGQAFMGSQQLVEAREAFTRYLAQQEEGIFAEGTRWVLAYLPEESDEPEQEFLNRVKRLQAIRQDNPDSHYAPWALCAMGDIYWHQRWFSEANALYEEFLQTYPGHPLAGGVMVEAGRGYLENQKYLEAALIFRRVVEEPRWEAHRLQGARGLANATAFSKAWSQADYWFQVVEAERPDLLRQSVQSAYQFGITELALGNHEKARTWLLNTINNHPDKTESGKALNQLAMLYMKQGHDFLGLWFAEQAKLRFPGKEISRRARAIQNKWVLKFLSQEHSSQEWDLAYGRLEELEIFLSISWDQGLETARLLSQSPEGDLAEESTLWMGWGYEALGDYPAAIRAYEKVLALGISPEWKQEAETRLQELFSHRIQAMYKKKAWVKLLKFHSEYQSAFRLLPLERDRVMMVAQAFQHVSLPSEAVRWYDQLLTEYPKTSLREEIMGQKVLLAESQGKNDWIRQFGKSYLDEFPEGQWRGAVGTALGVEALGRNDYDEAIVRFTEALPYLPFENEQRYVLRNRAQAFQSKGLFDKARMDFQRLVSMKPPEVIDELRYADFLYDQGDYEDAQPLYEHVLTTKSPVALKAWGKYRLGLSLEHIGRFKEARKYLDEIQQIETQPPELEYTIRAAASAVIHEFTLKHKPRVGKEYEAS